MPIGELPLAEFVGYRAVNLRYIFGILRNRQRGLLLGIRIFYDKPDFLAYTKKSPPDLCSEGILCYFLLVPFFLSVLLLRSPILSSLDCLKCDIMSSKDISDWGTVFFGSHISGLLLRSLFGAGRGLLS